MYFTQWSSTRTSRFSSVFERKFFVEIFLDTFRNICSLIWKKKNLTQQTNYLATHWRPLRVDIGTSLAWMTFNLKNSGTLIISAF